MTDASRIASGTCMPIKPLTSIGVTLLLLSGAPAAAAADGCQLRLHAAIAAINTSGPMQAVIAYSLSDDGSLQTHTLTMANSNAVRWEIAETVSGAMADIVKGLDGKLSATETELAVDTTHITHSTRWDYDGWSPPEVRLSPADLLRKALPVADPVSFSDATCNGAVITYTFSAKQLEADSAPDTGREEPVSVQGQLTLDAQGRVSKLQQVNPASTDDPPGQMTATFKYDPALTVELPNLGYDDWLIIYAQRFFR